MGFNGRGRRSQIRLHFCWQRWNYLHYIQCHLNPKCCHPWTFYPCPWRTHPPTVRFSLGSLFGSDSSDTGYGYGFDQASYEQGYESSANAYNSFSKRSIEMMGPVMEALRKGDDEFQKNY